MESLGRSALIPVIGVILLFLVGKSCIGHPYEVTGTYEAPVGAYRVVVSSKQREVAAEDADLDLLRANSVKITSINNPLPVITLDFLDFGKVKGSINAASTVFDWSAKDGKDTLQKLLVQAGYVNPPENEIQEMVAAIEGVTHGPTGIIVNDSQVKRIKVVSVVSK
jgi:hypothetical protein